jgi:hypothetical protein
MHDMLGKHILRQAWHESAFGSRACRKKQGKIVKKRESCANTHRRFKARYIARTLFVNVRRGRREDAGVGHWGMSSMRTVRHPLHLRTRRAVVREGKGVALAQPLRTPDGRQANKVPTGRTGVEQTSMHA